MAGKLRVQYPGALDHVMNRGARREEQRGPGEAEAGAAPAGRNGGDPQIDCRALADG